MFDIINKRKQIIGDITNINESYINISISNNINILKLNDQISVLADLGNKSKIYHHDSYDIVCRGKIIQIDNNNICIKYNYLKNNLKQEEINMILNTKFDVLLQIIETK